jgi:hypothetical protein
MLTSAVLQNTVAWLCDVGICHLHVLLKLNYNLPRLYNV